MFPKRLQTYFNFFLLGLMLPLGFAPFHLPGFSFIALAIFYYQLSKNLYSAFFSGLFFGLGFFGLGVSWVYNSIYTYGHIAGFLAVIITLIFILYLSLFPALMAKVFCFLNRRAFSLGSALLFAALWVLNEYLRSTVFTGFPWLLVGVGQMDSPLKYFLPLVGIFGISFFSAFLSALLGNSFGSLGLRRQAYLCTFVSLIILPLAFKNLHWEQLKKEPISVGVIQANLSMRDKWDEKLFWKLIARYESYTQQLLGTKLIVLPESAIPLPPTYVNDFLKNLNSAAAEAGSAILLGIPQPTNMDEDSYFNTLSSLGKASGSYYKQHLVPFGEYIPEVLQAASEILGVPTTNLKAGAKKQVLIKVHKAPIASLICYELAYANILRQQLPKAEWIVSISDDGWFGHSLAMYQQQQMAQALSMQAARYQVLANNDGLSSLINPRGEIEASLPAYKAGILKSSIFAATGTTPWSKLGDLPALLISVLIIIYYVIYRGVLNRESKEAIAANLKRRYPNQLN